MKTTYLIGLLLILGFSSHATTANTHPDEALLCLQNQLTAHNWESEHSTVWQFNADGSLLQFNAGASQVQQGQWTLHIAEGQLMLRVNLGAGQTYWSWEADCSQANLQLASQDAAAIQLKALPAKSATARWLTGDWQEGVYAHTPLFTFAPDGSYQRLQDDSEDLRLSTGHWMLSKDGNTLLLYRPDGKLDAYAIKYINMDELVLQAYEPGATDRFLNKL